MAQAIISLDQQQIIKLEQVLLDRDEKGTWELLSEIREQVRGIQDTRCGIEKLKK